MEINAKQKIYNMFSFITVVGIPIVAFMLWFLAGGKSIVNNIVIISSSILLLAILLANEFFISRRFVQRAKERKYLIFIVGGLVGIIFFAGTLGVTFVNPRNINWLMHIGTDIAQHFLGWHFFRQEVWHFPLGNIEKLGYPIGTSIGLTDAIPLFAIPFKVINRFLPDIFQYLGLWSLLCYILQGGFAALLMSLITEDIVLIFLGTIFFVCSPIMFSEIIGHNALGAHCILLCALYFNFSSTRKFYKWLILICITALIHPYLYVMCFGLFVADAANRLLHDEYQFKKFWLDVCVTIILSFILLWLVGNFQVSFVGLQIGGYGTFSMNLNSLINSEGWSRFLLDFPQVTAGQIGGFNYLGLGFLLLLFCFFMELIQKPALIIKLKKHLPLLIFSILCFLYAISNKVTFNQYVLFSFKFPSFIQHLCEIFRVSGRFFWPVYYLIMYLVFLVVIRFMDLKRRTIIFLMLCSMLIQFADLTPVFRGLQFLYNVQYQNAWTSVANSPFWQKASSKYHKIIFMPNNLPKNYDDFLLYAANNKMSVSSWSSARCDSVKLDNLSSNIMTSFMNGQFDPDAIYVITDDKVLNTLTQNVRAKIYIRKINGYYIGVVD